MKWRLVALKVVIFLSVVAVWLRLVYWQVVASDNLRQQASSQRLTVVEVAGKRGEIQASDGQPLVANKANYLLYANPKLAVGGDAWDKLSELLPASDSAKLVAKLDQKQLGWVALSDAISPTVKTQIEQLSLPGVGFQYQPVRMYPEGSSSAQLVGFVGKDETGPKGYFGLEGYYDRQLAGRSGKIVMESDALGRPIVISGQNLFPAVDGQDVKTSIDRTLQFILASKLAAGILRYGASAGTITVMDPQTGQIMGMVSLPNYDQANFGAYDSSLYKNPVVAEGYEPGSTFKVVVMASALDAGVVKPDTVCDICSGPVTVADYVIRTWNDKYFAKSTMTDVIVHSDNVGMVFVSKHLGKQKLLDYLHRFGLGTLTGVDLQEESSPQIRPDSQWTEVDLATAAFGQGVAVTPLQMLRSVAAIANGGKLARPHVANDDSQAKTKTEQVISPAAAAQITQMMVTAVENGEAKWAKPKGYSVAGKTGTAQIPIAGHYDENKTIASFVGFAPPYKPKFVMLVTLREPQTSPWGSETAAPLWFDVAKELFRYYQILPDKSG